jgi:hypothetical protein
LSIEEQKRENNEKCLPLKRCLLMAVVVFFLLKFEGEEVEGLRGRREVAVVDGGKGNARWSWW